ncbi:DUF255 domain-containing protein [Streptomyces sp. NPDC046985]|uniref:DUF255 domain-containing protein n=1 Tax=Streptomyces sp. NPDC046985 TaxID=3155377 RepID=UPI0033D5A720
MKRLANSRSSYLLQHASHPVDWWPWGEGATQEAKRRDVPVLLSVGYSSCHSERVRDRLGELVVGLWGRVG